MSRFYNIFKKGKCSVIGMIHVGALPGTPLYSGNTKKIISNAIEEAITYSEYNIDGILVENMHDIPYVKPKDLTPETTAIMTRICTEVRKVLPENIPCGIQILAGCNKEAIAVAKAANLQFIRAEGFVFSHIADEGFTDACAGSLLRYRKQIDADDILILADIKKKHSSHAITSDVSSSETVKAAKFFLADGIILTGITTGDPVNVSEFTEIKQNSKIPVLIGSGVTKDNIKDYLSSDAVIVGSHFKISETWQKRIDKKKVSNFMAKMKDLQNFQ
ncbi:uncharacterized protein F13E9.13, mitochondrial isoform X1 [Bombus huntii]|uniref:uncharacterized protein F13E9.13, mitochondrial isoform X1 n=1 Tax=Bombus huntii TaxID=85661 RepID=UPI0021A9A80A|nr:uncharacterized protein F13E9.13, mitochondrial isoform X1 [Bombus huntii]XP_050493321.1 uncharacterized protein F13E9.13, mitochondrial isoform X1 [Bombus huntii]